MPKNNKKSNSYVELNLGKLDYNGHDCESVWDIYFDWKNRIRAADMKVIIGNRKFERHVKSYLFTK